MEGGDFEAPNSVSQNISMLHYCAVKVLRESSAQLLQGRGAPNIDIVAENPERENTGTVLYSVRSDVPAEERVESD